MGLCLSDDYKSYQVFAILVCVCELKINWRKKTSFGRSRFYVCKGMIVVGPEWAGTRSKRNYDHVERNPFVDFLICV